jgi:hypothetical protein
MRTKHSAVIFDFERDIFKRKELIEDLEDGSQTMCEFWVSFFLSRRKDLPLFQITVDNGRTKEPIIMQLSLISDAIFSKDNFRQPYLDQE